MRLMAIVIFVSTLLFLLPAVSPASASGTGDILLDAYFDNLPLGTAAQLGAPSHPDGFTPALCTAEVIDDGGGNQVLEICDTNAFSPAFVDFQLLSDQEVTAGGVISFFDADDLAPAITTSSYTAGVPLDFEVVYDMDAGTYDLSIDGALILDDELHDVTGRGLGRLQFGSGSDFDIGDCFTVDDVLVQLADGETAVNDTPGSNVGVAFAGAFPNPFNPATELQFELAGAGHVRLTIYDVAGRRVITLLDERRASGIQAVQWDGRDSRGKRQRSGVYFASLSGSGFEVIRKLTLLK